jgi:hypothetical protein
VTLSSSIFVHAMFIFLSPYIFMYVSTSMYMKPYVLVILPTLEDI